MIGMKYKSRFNAGEKLQFWAGYHHRIATFGVLFGLCVISWNLDPFITGINSKELVEAFKSKTGILFFFVDLWINGQKLNLDFLINNFQVMLLGLVTIWWFFQYSGAVANESKILKDLYTSSTKQRIRWNQIFGYKYIPIISITFLLLFMIACASVRWLYVYCLIALPVYLLDLIGNYMCQKNIKTFSNKRELKPSVKNPKYSYIIKRRSIARAYWIKKPQLVRIVFFAIITMIIGDFSYMWRDDPLGVFNKLGYIAMSCSITANEIIMLNWRYPRDKAISELMESEEDKELEKYEDDQ